MSDQESDFCELGSDYESDITSSEEEEEEYSDDDSEEEFEEVIDGEKVKYVKVKSMFEKEDAKALIKRFDKFTGLVDLERLQSIKRIIQIVDDGKIVFTEHEQEDADYDIAEMCGYIDEIIGTYKNLDTKISSLLKLVKKVNNRKRKKLEKKSTSALGKRKKEEEAKEDVQPKKNKSNEAEEEKTAEEPKKIVLIEPEEEEDEDIFF